MAVASRWPQRFSPAGLNELLDFPLGKVLARPERVGQLLHLLPLGRAIRALYFPLFPAECWLETVTVPAQKCNSIDIGLQTVTEGKERRSTWVKAKWGRPQGIVRFTPAGSTGRRNTHCPGGKDGVFDDT